MVMFVLKKKTLFYKTIVGRLQVFADLRTQGMCMSSLFYISAQARLFLPGLLQNTGQALLRIKWCIAIECSYLHTDLFGA